MTQPLLHEIERHARANGVKAEAVPQPFRRGMRPLSNARRAHHRLHEAPGATAGELPELAMRVPVADPVNGAEDLHDFGRQRKLP